MARANIINFRLVCLRRKCFNERSDNIVYKNKISHLLSVSVNIERQFFFEASTENGNDTRIGRRGVLPWPKDIKESKTHSWNMIDLACNCGMLLNRELIDSIRGDRGSFRRFGDGRIRLIAVNGSR